MKKIKQFLTSATMIEAVLPTVNELVTLLKKKKLDNKKISILYGETYDQFGVTVDSLKYYFILSLIHYHLEKKGFKVTSTIVQADIASLINKSSQDKKPELINQKKHRLDLLNTIIKTYYLPIEIKLMSELFKSNQYERMIKLVNNFAQSQSQNSKFFNNLEKTVLQNRLKQEKQNGFKYALEAIATGMLFDIKLGPPREQFYDKAQHLMADNIDVDKVHCIYLKPSYPLGKNFAFFLSNPKIEQFGLTPYKAGSNKMQSSRIILKKTTSKQLKYLIENSFESSNINVAHPVLDMFVISDIAKRLAKKNQEMPVYNQNDLLSNINNLKKETISAVDKYILEKLRYEK